MWKLFLAFTIIPAVELYLLIQIGQWLGPGLTVLIILLTGSVGAWLAKREGLGVLKALEQESRAGFPSGNKLIEGLMVLIGGVLLVTPGVLTDITGFVLIAPPTRTLLAPMVKAAVMRRFNVTATAESQTVYGQGAPPRPPAEPNPPQMGGGGHFDHPEL